MKTEEIFEYVQKQYGTVPEYLWSKSPDSVVLRHKNGKWYAVFMTVEKSKLGLEGNDLVAIMDVKCDPEMTSMIMQKCTSNQRNKNNLNDNHLIRTNSSRLSLGEYQNVFLTEKEYKRLKADFAGLDGLIEQLSAYIQSTGEKYADHAATLRIWAKRQNAEKKTAPGIPDYTFAEGESL